MSNRAPDKNQKKIPDPPPSSIPAARGSNRSIPLWLQAAFLFVVTVIVYIPATHGKFIWDDALMLTDNPAVKSPHGLSILWSVARAVEFAPMTYSSFWLEWRLWGANPAGYHVTNIFLQAVCALLLWRVLLQIPRLPPPAAWVAALLFAVHPVCVASVVWIAERKNTLSMIFYLASLLLYFRSGEGSKRGTVFYWCSIAAFALALLSKSSVVVLPVVLLLCVWWRDGRIPVRALIRSLPYFALAAIMGLVSMKTQQKDVHLAHSATDPLLIRLIGGSWAVWFYLGKILMPVGLAMIYPRWPIDPHSPLSYLPAILMGVLLALFWSFRRGWGRACLFATGYFLIAVGPTLGVFDMAYFSISRVSDHLQYLALPGVLALVAVGTTRLTPRVALRVPVIIIAGLLSFLTWRHARTFSESISLWTDNAVKAPKEWRVYNNLGAGFSDEKNYDAAVRAYRAGLAIAPDSGDLHLNLGNAYYAMDRFKDSLAEYRLAVKDGQTTYESRCNLGVVLLKTGDAAGALSEFEKALALKAPNVEARRNLGEALAALGKNDEAASNFQAALELDPGNAGVANELGAALDRSGHHDLAIAQFQKLAQMDPGNAEARKNLGLVLSRAGRLDEAIAELWETVKIQPLDSFTRSDLADLLEKKGLTGDAIAQFNEALRLSATNSAAHAGLGTVFDKSKNYGEALVHFEAAVKLDPTNAIHHKNLGLVLARVNRIDEAAAQLREAIRLKPGDADTHSELGNLLGRQGRVDEAYAEFQKALALDPAIAGAQNGLGVVLDTKGRVDDAIPHFREAVRLDPGLTRARYNLANALLRKGRRAEAATEFEEVLKQQPRYPQAAEQLRELRNSH